MPNITTNNAITYTNSCSGFKFLLCFDCLQNQDKNIQITFDHQQTNGGEFVVQRMLLVIQTVAEG